MKKIIGILLALLMVVTMTGCGRSAEYDEGRSTRKASAEEREDKKKEDADEKSSGSSGIKANKNLVNEDKIPDGYPLDLVPFPAGAEINHGEKSDYMGMPHYYTVAISKDNFKDIVAFYRELYKNGGLDELEAGGGYTIQGIYEKMNIIVSIKDEKRDPTFGPEYKTSIFIDVYMLDDDTLRQIMGEAYTGGKSGGDLGPVAEKGNANAIKGVNTNLSGKPVPANYRTDVLPIPEGMEIFYTYSEDEVSILGETFYAVEGYSEYEMEDLAAYYENLFKDKEDFKPGKSKYPYTMNAKAENVEISVQMMLPTPDVDKSIKTQVSLMMKIHHPEYEPVYHDYFEYEYSDEDQYEEDVTVYEEKYKGGNADVIDSVNSNIAGEPIPEGFDTGMIPIPSESEITSVQKNESAEYRRYYISGISRYEIKDMVAFYKRILQAGEDYMEFPKENSFTIECRLNGAFITVFIGKSQYEYDGFYSSFGISIEYN